MTDVLVLGAGLAGLAAARDLANAGTDVLVLEARGRVGGRVEQLAEDGRRPVQLGGEVVGPVHTAYLGLVEELGLTLEPSYTGVPGQTTYDLLEGVERADDFPHRDGREREDYERVEREWAKLISSVDPDDPWAHPDAGRLDSVSIGTWLRSVDALPSTIRRLEVGSLGLADGSIEHSSLLAELRKSAAVDEREFYSHERWESLQVAEGSAEVAERLASELGERVRLERRGRLRAGRRRVPRHARIRRGAPGGRGRLRPTCARRCQARHRRRRSGPPAVASGSTPRAGGEGGRRLRSLGLGRHGLERPVGGRARTGLDVAAG